jgi:TPR repeat protein
MKAARQGHKPAQRILVGLYASGLGVERSYVNAVSWYVILG